MVNELAVRGARYVANTLRLICRVSRGRCRGADVATIIAVWHGQRAAVALKRGTAPRAGVPPTLCSGEPCHRPAWRCGSTSGCHVVVRCREGAADTSSSPTFIRACAGGDGTRPLRTVVAVVAFPGLNSSRKSAEARTLTRSRSCARRRDGGYLFWLPSGSRWCRSSRRSRCCARTRDAPVYAPGHVKVGRGAAVRRVGWRGSEEVQPDRLQGEWADLSYRSAGIGARHPDLAAGCLHVLRRGTWGLRWGRGRH